MLSTPAYSLGFSSDHAQSAYYPEPSRMTKEEISSVSQQLECHLILPENTRIRKVETTGQIAFEVLQASVEIDAEPREFRIPGSNNVIRLVRGDHSAELDQICSALSEASTYASTRRQQVFVSQFIESFQTGNLENYRDSQRTWVSDLNPRVENIFGFVEPYRDPFGTRAEFEALVAIADPEETKVLTKLVENSTTFIRRLPWALVPRKTTGKAHLRRRFSSRPISQAFTVNISVAFTRACVDGANSSTALAYCSSILFGGINLPNVGCICCRRKAR